MIIIIILHDNRGLSDNYRITLMKYIKVNRRDLCDTYLTGSVTSSGARGEL